MTNHRAVAKALTLVRPVLASVTARKPVGMTRAEADTVMLKLKRAKEELEYCVDIFSDVDAAKGGDPK